MKATQVLIDEHSGLMVILKVLEKINSQISQDSQFNIDHVDEIIEFFQVFLEKFILRSRKWGWRMVLTANAAYSQQGWR